jgi:glycosyltransferase involved in cell wall biosynthesis
MLPERRQGQEIQTSHRSRWVALLGRRDEPTDALVDYCSFLSDALAEYCVQLDCEQVLWNQIGSFKAFARLWNQSVEWSGRWVLLQYTALGWSRRGFSFRILVSVIVLKLRRVKCAIVFHDLRGYGGSRIIDRVRNLVQRWIMREAYRLADRSIFSLPIKNVSWLPPLAPKASFISIGANLPELECQDPLSESITIAVFSMTGGEALALEVQDIGQTLRHVSKNHKRLNLLLLGRNSKEAEPAMTLQLEGTTVHLEVFGVISPNDVVRRLSASDVLLFVRGAVSGTRSSALAGVACGLPIVGYHGCDTTFPITEAGLALAPFGNLEALGRALDRVLSDVNLRKALRLRSSRAHRKYYRWTKIAAEFVKVLEHA